MTRVLFANIALSLGLMAFATTAVASEDYEEGSTEEVVVDDPSEATEVADDFGHAHRQRIYESSRLETRRALLYSAAFPGLGNFYAEQYALGTVMMMSMVFSGMFLGYGIVNDHSDLIALGVASTGLTYLTGGTFAYLGVRRYNDNLRRSLHIDDSGSALLSDQSDQMDDQAWMLELRLRF